MNSIGLGQTQLSSSTLDDGIKQTSSDQQSIQIEADPEKSNILAALAQFATLSQILRFGGAAIMVASMSMFLLQSWDIGNDVGRYFLLLAQTLLLTVGGFGLSYLLQENKGARVFFGLALVSIPANFTILGALVYSLTQWDRNLAEYPGFANWIAPDPSSLLLTMAAAALLLTPLTLFSYGVIARRSSKPLSLALLASSATLLLPIRESLPVGSLIALSVLALVWFVGGLSKRDPMLRTGEGLFARLLLFVPPGIALVRSFLLYEPDALLAATLALTTFIVMRQSSLQLLAGHWLRTLLELASPLVALLLAGFFVDSIDHLISGAAQLPTFALLLGGLIVDVARRCGRHHSLYVNVAAMVMVGGTALNMLPHPSLSGALLCCVVGISVLSFGLSLHRRWLSVCGIAAAATGSLYLLEQLAQWISLGSWTSLAIVGATAIVAASVLDRHGVTVKLRISNWLRQASKPTPIASGELDTKS